MDAAVARSYGALNDYFDRIFVLTLRRATNRHSLLERALSGLRYEVVYGSDKVDLELAELEAGGMFDDRAARHLHRYGRGVTLGHIACVLSRARLA